MRGLLRAVLFCGWAFLLGGCAGGPVLAPGETLSTLADVNRVLEGHGAQVELADGTVLDAREVRVAPDSVRFVAGSGRAAVPTREVLRVSVPRSRISPGSGGVYGAAFMTGLVLLAATTEPSTGLVAPYAVGVGVLLGGLVGLLDQVGPERVTVYEAPLDPYLAPAED